MPKNSAKSRKPERSKALRNLLEGSITPSEENTPIPEDEVPDESHWRQAAENHRLGVAEREMAGLRDLADSYRHFLGVLESQPDLFFAGDPHILVRNVLQTAMDFVGAERAAFFRLDTHGRLRLRQTLPDGVRFDKISRSLVRDALLEKRTHYHLGGEDLRGAERDSVLHLGLEAVAVVPLRVEDRVMGVLYLDSHAGGRFSPVDVPTLEMLTRVAAAAMRRLDQLNEARKTGRRLELENQELRSVLHGRARFGRLAAESPSMRRVIDQLKRMVPLKTTVRLEGETGTGKEVIARVLHEEGPWSEGRFVPINCGAIPETLIEAELFGFQKGAFTGADQNRMGLIEESDAGTLFLDEIGDLPLDMQVKLLRVLENGDLRRLGDNRDRNVDFRLIVASNKNLEALVEEGSFRKDLFYRINVLHVLIPPLRERREDILLLIQEFLEFYSRRMGLELPRLSAGAVKKAEAYGWPGNIRQLQKCIERSLALRDPGSLLHEEELLLDGISPDQVECGESGEELRTFLRRMERGRILQVLSDAQGRVTAASRVLGVSRQTLYEKIRSHGIEY